MDRTENHVETLLRELNPQIVFFVFQHWLPNLTRRLGIKCIQYWIVNPLSVAYFWNGPRQSQGTDLTDLDLMQPPPGFPDSFIKLHAHELRFLAASRKMEFGNGVLLYDRLDIGARLADANAFKGCREIEGPYVDYLETVYKKPVDEHRPSIKKVYERRNKRKVTT
ncbi:UDP-glycosyltransferase 79B30-like [Lotus japonicus]|uniref:UDP-glycosyltransferase 79B30-like n=1 Tax=Lotus japonicus TaxID=34305 RepID=UPI00258C1F97|nr:UDP-glycosyltransferase 79B30-like [Lotus japonicus]